MSRFFSKKEAVLLYRVLSLFFVVAFMFNLVLFPVGVHAQVAPEGVLNLPLPGTMLTPTSSYNPPMMTGVVINPNNPLEFEFMINHGDADLDGEAFQREAEKLTKYFLSTLTIPEEKLWVNLSPYEKDQMISQVFGETEMGRDLLAQDYILKQLSASLMYPKDELGKKFWDRVYSKAYEQFETKDIPINTFNKVWILPDKADIYENEMGAFIIDSHLKVMLEEDYMALEQNMGNKDLGLESMVQDDAKQVSELTTRAIREIMIPEIEKEVNEGATFANLRQIYNSMILGAWYKKNLKESFLGKVYVDQNKIEGVDLQDPTVKQRIYEQYLAAFQKGVYDYTKRDFDPATNEVMIQRYSSGGFTARELPRTIETTPLADISTQDYAFAASQMMQSSSPISQQIVSRELASLPLTRQADVRRELARLPITSSPVSRVTVQLASQEGVTDFAKEIGRALGRMGADSTTSPIEIQKVSTNLRSDVTDRLSGRQVQPISSGTMHLAANPTEAKQIAVQAMAYELPVVRISEAGEIAAVSVDSSGELIADEPMRIEDLTQQMRSGVRPVIITMGEGQGIDQLSEAPAAMSELAESLLLNAPIEGGTMQMALSSNQVGEIARQAQVQDLPVVQVSESGEITQLDVSTSGEITVNPITPQQFDSQIRSDVKPVVIAMGDQAVRALSTTAPTAIAEISQATALGIQAPEFLQGGTLRMAVSPFEVGAMVRQAQSQNLPVVQVNEQGGIAELRVGANKEISVTPITPQEFTSQIRSDTKPVVIAMGEQAVVSLNEAAPEVIPEIARNVVLNAPVQSGTIQIAATQLEVERIARAASPKPAVRISEAGEIDQLNIDSGGSISADRISPQDLVDQMRVSETRPIVVAMGDQAVRELATAAPAAIAQIARATASYHRESRTLNTLRNDIDNSFAQGSGNISVPASEMASLRRRSATFAEAETRIQAREQGRMTAQQARAGNMVPQLDQLIGDIARDIDTSPSIDQRRSGFYQLQAAVTLRGKVTDTDVSVPLVGLTPNELTAIDAGQFTTPQLGKTIQALYSQQAGLNRLVVGLSAPDAQEGQEFIPALEVNIGQVSQQIAQVTSSMDQNVRFDRELQAVNAGLPGARADLLDTSIATTSDVPSAVARIAEAGTLVLLAENEPAKRISQQEAIDTLATQSTVYVTPQATIIRLAEGSPARSINQPEQRMISDFQPRDIDASRTLARLSAIPDVGGIDLNPALLDMQIKRDGEGVTLPISEQPIDTMNIQGFAPVIIDVSPASFSMPMNLNLGQLDLQDDNYEGSQI